MRTKELKEKGYKVLRLWESDIKVMKLEDLKNKLIYN
jgi:very-short-patch-repair endonuclease